MPINTQLSDDLAKIAKLNGNFRKNYGPLLGAYLYLRSISAARGRTASSLWGGRPEQAAPRHRTFESHVKDMALWGAAGQPCPN